MTNLNKKIKKNRGMTYIELIVVLSIFAIMAAVSMVSYRGFQAKIDIKNLASDIALQIVGAQKDAIGGKLGTSIFITKPSYGIYFDLSPSSNKEFVYFADFDNNGIYDPNNNEKLNTIQITKGDKISSLEVVDSNISENATNHLTILFRRPDSGAIISTDSGTNYTQFSKIMIGISSSDGVAEANIEVYPSGRIQIKNVN
jgi:prepilin-type N-terminal cleavage/methylation domain-containing protein